MKNISNRITSVAMDKLDERMQEHSGRKFNRSERRALAKLQRKDEKFSRKIKQLESKLQQEEMRDEQ